MPIERSNQRTNVRHGAVTRVALGDNELRINATTRDISLGGMCLMTATKTLPADRTLIATVSIERRGQGSTCRLPVRVVWSNNTSAGVAFEHVTAEAREALREMLNETRARRSRSH